MRLNGVKRVLLCGGIMGCGILGTAQVSKTMAPAQYTQFSTPTFMVYAQDWHEDTDPLSIEIKAPAPSTPKKSTKTVEQTKSSTRPYTEKDIITISKLVYGEGRGLNKTEMSAIVWCVLNRVDSKIFPNTIYEVCTQKGQFHGYKAHHPVWDNIKELVEDVLKRWAKEKAGAKNVGRTLPKSYLFFVGDGRHNHYMEKWRSGIYYNWNLKSPYK